MITITATRRNIRNTGATGYQTRSPMTAESMAAELAAAGYVLRDGVWSKPGSPHRFRISEGVRQ